MKNIYARIINGFKIGYSWRDVLFFLKFQLSKKHFKSLTTLTLKRNEIKTVVISLKFRKDRRNYITEHFHSKDISFDFFDAIHGKTQIKEVHKTIPISKASQKYLSIASLGCIASHIKLWKKAIESTQESFLIFEDDVILKYNFPKILSLLNEVPCDADIIYLGSGSNKTWLNMKYVSNNVAKSFSIRKGAYGYLLKKRGAKKILANIKEISITCGSIDTILGILCMRGKLVAYHITPSICEVDFSFSSNIFNISNSSKALHQMEYK